jgi:hypothetical protein
MAVYSANKPNRTVTLYKPECRLIPLEKLKSCRCGDTGKAGNQRWFCEEHVTTNNIRELLFQGLLWESFGG